MGMCRSIFVGLLFLGVLLILLGGCQNSVKVAVNLKPSGKVSEAQRFLPEDIAPFMVGAAQVDITPPPGYPMGGFSIAGRISRGWWTRLYAKAIYIEDGKQHRMVLVSCDLWAMPAGLADKVAELIAARIPASHQDSAYIGREQILFAATHTHHGPGNFSTSATYNSTATALAGFDRALFDFLAHRITEAVVRAVEAKQAGVIRKAVLNLPGLSRNRSLEAFEMNSQAEKTEVLNLVSHSEANFSSDLQPTVSSRRVFQAVDPRLTVLKFEPVNPEQPPLAVAAFYAIHPNTMGPKTEVYNSDIFGVASILIEQRLQNEFPNESTVVAFFNGAEGDIAPNWKNQDRADALDIGQQLAQGVLTAITNANEEIAGDISYRYEVVKIADAQVTDLHRDADVMCDSTRKMQTARKPYPGVATLGGSEEGRSFLYYLGLREGVKLEECDDRQGRKFFAIESFIEKILQIDDKQLLHDSILDFAKKYSAKTLPEQIPLGVYTIGPLVLGTLPGEFTVALGNRIKHALRETTGSAEVLLIGLANEYLSYFTTPSEYDAQHYEGASTMYGQAAGLLVEQELARIARLPQNTANYKNKIIYDVGPPAPEEFGEIAANEPWQCEEALANMTRTGTTVRRNLPQFVWWDESNFFAKRKEAGSAVSYPAQVNPVVSIEQKIDNGWQPLRLSTPGTNGNGIYNFPESEQTSLNFVTVIDSVAGDSSRWRTIWLFPDYIDAQQTFRFNVKTPCQKTICSAAFRLDSFVLKE